MNTATLGRRIAAAALSAGLLLSPMTALAQTVGGNDVADASFTVTGVNQGDTVKAYQVFDADIDASNNLTYTTKVENLPSGYTTAADLVGKNGRTVADAIAPVVTGTTPTYSGVAGTDGKATFSLDSGLYLVTVTSTSGNTKIYQTMLVNASPQVSATGSYVPADLEDVEAKSEEVTKPTKEIVIGSNTTKETDQYSVGDTVNFRITGTIPSYPSNATKVTYSLTDVPQVGLSVDQDSFVVKNASGSIVDAANYKLTVSDGKYTIAFSEDYIKKNAGQTVKVEYSAVVNSVNTTTGKVGNQAYGTFNPNPYEETTADTDPDKTEDQTYGFTFRKVGKNDKDVLSPLAGAEFTIYDANGKAVTYMDASGAQHTDGKVTSDAYGYVYANGLKAGTYTIKETGVPSGFQKVNDFTIALDESDTSDSPATSNVQETNFDVTTTDVEDPKQGVLPSTGGAGTVALTAGGILFVAGGSAALLASRRRNQE